MFHARSRTPAMAFNSNTDENPRLFDIRKSPTKSPTHEKVPETRHHNRHEICQVTIHAKTIDQYIQQPNADPNSSQTNQIKPDKSPEPPAALRLSKRPKLIPKEIIQHCQLRSQNLAHR